MRSSRLTDEEKSNLLKWVENAPRHMTVPESVAAYAKSIGKQFSTRLYYYYKGLQATEK